MQESVVSDFKTASATSCACRCCLSWLIVSSMGDGHHLSSILSFTTCLVRRAVHSMGLKDPYFTSRMHSTISTLHSLLLFSVLWCYCCHQNTSIASLFLLYLQSLCGLHSCHCSHIRRKGQCCLMFLWPLSFHYWKWSCIAQRHRNLFSGSLSTVAAVMQLAFCCCWRASPC